jgi:hypothetical protein
MGDRFRRFQFARRQIAEARFTPKGYALGTQPTYARRMAESRLDWLAYGTSAAGRIFLGREADPNACPNCGRLVEGKDVLPVSPAADGGEANEIARCQSPGCSASLARLVNSDGERSAWSAVVAAPEVE